MKNKNIGSDESHRDTLRIWAEPGPEKLDSKVWLFLGRMRVSALMNAIRA